MRQSTTETKSSRWRAVLTAASVIVMLVLVGAGACAKQADPGETVESLRAGSPTLRDKTRWRVVIRDSVPLLSYRDAATGKYSGFDVEIAKAVAVELGFDEQEIDWIIPANNTERLSLLQSGSADMTVATVSITHDREELVDFAGPYLLVPQAVMVPRQRTKSLETIADLREKDVRVCAPVGTTSAIALEAKGIVPVPVNTHEQCMEGMRAGKFDAYSTDLTILLGFLSNKSDFDAFEISDIAVADTVERFGIALPNNDENLRKLVSYILERWRTGPPESSPWLRAYDRTIGPLLDLKYRSQPLVDNPPELADYDSKAPRQ